MKKHKASNMNPSQEQINQYNIRAEVYNQDFTVFFEVFDNEEARIHTVFCSHKKQVIDLKHMLKKLVKKLGVLKTEKRIFLKEVA